MIKTQNSSVIRQRGESQNGCFKKTKHDKFSEKRKCSFFGKFGVLCFLRNTRFEIRCFALLLTNCFFLSFWSLRFIVHMFLLQFVFSFKGTDDLQDISCRKGTIFIYLWHFHPLINIQIFICNFASEMITLYFQLHCM